jgi:ATP/ADP translocase
VTDQKASLAAMLTATALITQQVGGSAIRDGLFLSFYSVQSFPYLIAGAALFAIVAAPLSGRLLTRFGPARAVPRIIAAHATLFVVEWLLLGPQPRLVAVLLYLHSSVLGGIAISTFWSLLNERFDPHTAKPLLARVAGAATFGGLLGGLGAERVAALLPEGALLPLLALVSAACVAGVMVLGKGAPAHRTPVQDTATRAGAWVELRQPLLRNLAMVTALAAVLAALADYILKAEAVAYFGKGPQLVRFFGLFYSGTGLAAVLVQAGLGKFVLERLGLGGSVASHPVFVGISALLGLALPAPWRGMLPRGCDVVVRASMFRAGYELLYTPIAESAKRAVKSLIDVAIDSAGKGGGAVLILLLAPFVASHGLTIVNLAAVAVAAAELFVALRLRAGYVSALEGGLRRQSGADLEQAVEYSMADFTFAGSMTGLDRTSVLRALGTTTVAEAPPPPVDPVVAALIELRSDDLRRIHAALRDVPRDPLLIAALVPLLAKDKLVKAVVAALERFGTRAAGELVSVLLDPAAPDVVRRRLPIVLKSCASPISRDGLRAGLESDGFEIRLRCGRALLALTEDHAELQEPFPRALALAQRELGGGDKTPPAREHLFNLLALALEREPVQIAARAFATEDAYVRGTALEYLATVLPGPLFSAFQPLLTTATAPVAVRRREPAAARAELLRAGATMTVSLDELRRQLDVAPVEDAKPRGSS